MANRWSSYPSLVKALHTRDWATLTALYRAGAPGAALFPVNVGETSLNLDRTAPRPDQGVLSLPAALVYAHGIYQQDTVYERTLMPDLWDDETEDALRELVQAWEQAGRTWDDLHVVDHHSDGDQPRWYRSVSLLAAEHMVPEPPGSWRLVHFEADVQPWLERFLAWGWTPQPVAGIPMVHQALQCGRLTWAQALLDQYAGDREGMVPCDRLDNTPLHALAASLVHAWDDDRRQERLDWLREWPQEAWLAVNANGHTPLEHGLLACDLDLVEDGLNLADAQAWAPPLTDRVRKDALQQVEEQSNKRYRNRMMQLLHRWETQQLRGAVPEDVSDNVRRPRRL